MKMKRITALLLCLLVFANMFACEMIATKVVSIAQERIQALEHMGFSLSEESVIGHNGTKYDSYYVREV